MSPSKCYYLDGTNGSDTNPGTYAAPWKSFANVFSYYNTSQRPAGWKALAPGDFVYLTGELSQKIVHNPACTSQCVVAISYFSAVNGAAGKPITLKSYPGQRASIGPSAGKMGGEGINLFNSKFWNISGIEFQNVTGVGLGIETDQDVVISDLLVHNNASGVQSGNPAGIKIRVSKNVEVYGSTFYENVENPVVLQMRGNGIQLFANTGFIKIHDNTFYQLARHPIYTAVGGTPTGATRFGNCLMYKHASPDPASTYEVWNNTFDQCDLIGSSTYNTHFHHNVVTRSSHGFRSKDFAGPTHQVNNLIEFNTFYNGTTGVHFDPSIQLAGEPNNIVAQKNIIYQSGVQVVQLNQYMSDVEYNAILPEFNPDHNCYFVKSGAAPTFAFGWANGGAYGTLGKIFSLAEWQAMGKDVNSKINQDPLFVNAVIGDFRLQSGSPCAGMGAK